MRVVIREDFTKPRCDQLLLDIGHAIETLDSMEPKEIESHVALIKRSVTHHGKRRNHSRHYKEEKHSLAKHGKSQIIC